MANAAVIEASETYASAMRNIAPPGPGGCAVCWTFVSSDYGTCISCGRQPRQLDSVVPITYSVAFGQMHTALRGYKDDPPESRQYPARRLLAILWRFLEEHEACVARASNVSAFDVVTLVPSSTTSSEASRGHLRRLVHVCGPVADRYQAVLVPAADAPPSSHTYNAARYETTGSLTGARVLLIDDTWTAGAHAQSAGAALRAAGATTVSAVVIGRHVDPTWRVTDDKTSEDCWAELPRAFDWGLCAVHER